MPSAKSCCSCAASASMPSESNGVRRWAVCSRRSLRLRAQEPPPHADQRLDQRPGAHPCPRPLRMLRRRLLLSKPRTSGPWRWTTSCPGTRAVRTTSATCRPSASAAMPASAMQFAYARGHHRLPRFQASDALRGTDQKGKVAATSERRISRVSGSMGEGSKPMCR